MEIPRKALLLVDQRLWPRLETCLQAGNWSGVLILPGSAYRVPLCLSILKMVPLAERPAVLANAISDGDLLRNCRAQLIRALGKLRSQGLLVFDGDAARQAFDALPTELTIYRGTVEAEGTRYGVSWTLDRQKAEWFATGPHRTRNYDSPSVILTASVMRDRICGLLLDRDENEVLVCPDAVTLLRVEPQPAAA